MPSSRDGRLSFDEARLSKISSTFNGKQRSTDSQDDHQISRMSSGESHQRFVLTDPVAFQYLMEDSSTTVMDRRRELAGYECYIVEQWATSRTHPTFVITTYTGDQSSKVIVGVLSVPTDETKWSPQLQVYFKALNHYHARRRETPLGIIMVTNLSGFPSSLTILAVPGGDLRKHRADFFVNENLKRLGCSGRSGLTFAYPNPATVAKFHQLYKTSDKNPLYSSVIELVKFCQAALHMFDVLGLEYVDGLLCDVTEKAINDWWLGIGSDIYNIEPHDGILGPTTVAALLGLLMGARNRLHALSEPVPKDPFELEEMKRGIARFQKGQRITRTRRLDRRTLLRLHKASEKYAYSEGWSMPKAVKSTVAEISGKGGEMLADAVRGRDRAAIAEIETPNIEQFHLLVFGERAKWLWLGKPLKRSTLTDYGQSSIDGALSTKPDERTNAMQNDRKGDDDISQPRVKESSTFDTIKPSAETASGRPSVELQESSRDVDQRTGVRKRATGLLDEGRSGFDRIKDAVHLRRHQTKVFKDDNSRPSTRAASAEVPSSKGPPTQRSFTSPVSSPTSPGFRERFGEVIPETKSEELTAQPEPDFAPSITETPTQSESSLIPPEAKVQQDNSSIHDQSTLTLRQEDVSGRSSARASFIDDIDPPEGLIEPEEPEQAIGDLLRRTQSDDNLVYMRTATEHPPNRFAARQLSFDIASSAITTSDQQDDSGLCSPADSLAAQLASEKKYAIDLKILRQSIATLSRNEAKWTDNQIDALIEVLSQASQDQRRLESSYHAPSHTHEELKNLAAAVTRDEKEALHEARRELETVSAKLDYEIGTLRGKVEDVEIGVDDFERAVTGVEDRVVDLEMELSGKRSWGCVVS